MIPAIFNTRRCIYKTLRLHLLHSLGTCGSGYSFNCGACIEGLHCFTISADSWGERLVRRDHKAVEVLSLNDRLLCDFAGTAFKLWNSWFHLLRLSETWVRLVSRLRLLFRGKVYHDFWIHWFPRRTLLNPTITRRFGLVTTASRTHT